jgi:hypothetical protein
VTEDQVHTLQHALGLDRERREPWRNYYCAEDGAPALEALVAAGLMQRRHTINGGEDRIYSVTAAGIDAAKAALPKAYSRSERRYRRFLDAADAYPGLTFREFLRIDRVQRAEP